MFCWKGLCDAMEESKNAYGKVSGLRAVAGENGGRTYLKELSFTAPYKLMSPFKLPDGSIRIMPLMASAGILEGDRQRLYLETEAYARMECVSQSYEKLHKMKNGSASRETCLKVGENSVLLYRPLPVIPFAESAFCGQTKIWLEDLSSCLFYQEILSCGRTAGGERFDYRQYLSLIEVRRNRKLIYRENNRFCPARDHMEGMGMFEGYSYLANILFFHKDASECIGKIRRLIEEQQGIAGGVTLTAESDIAVRILGSQVQRLQHLCESVCAIVKEETDLGT